MYLCGFAHRKNAGRRRLVAQPGGLTLGFAVHLVTPSALSCVHTGNTVWSHMACRVPAAARLIAYCCTRLLYFLYFKIQSKKLRDDVMQLRCCVVRSWSWVAWCISRRWSTRQCKAHRTTWRQLLSRQSLRVSFLYCCCTIPMSSSQICRNYIAGGVVGIGRCLSVCL